MLRNEQQEEISLFGIYFCRRCENVMTPFKGNGLQLDFKCLSCGVHELDFNDRKGERCMLYSKEINIAAKKEKELQIQKIIDPFMPTIETQCENCGYDRAFYFILPDKAETKVVIHLTCSRIASGQLRCGHTWVLDEGDDLHETRLERRRRYFG